MRKTPSKGIIIYVAFSVVGLVIAISGSWDKILEAVSKIGLTDQGAQAILDDMFNRLYRPTPGIIQARLVGRLIGGFMGLILIVGIIRLKEWARKIAIALHTIILVVMSFSIPKMFDFYAIMFKEELWLGYYLLGCLTLLSLIMVLVIIYFLTRPKVKALFSPKRAAGESKGVV